MATLEGDLEGGEFILGLGLIIVIGYFLYQWSTSFGNAVDQVLGISTNTNAATAPAGYGGTYTGAANQVLTNPLTSLETIVGLNQTQTPGATQPTMIGSVATNPGTGIGSAGGGGGAF